MLTKFLGIAVIAAAMPAMAQFGAEFSATRATPPPAAKKAAVQGQTAPFVAPAAEPQPKVSKAQKFSNAMQSVTRNIGAWTPQLPEDDPNLAAAGYVPPQGSKARFLRKGVRVMQGIASLGGAPAGAEPQQ